MRQRHDNYTEAEWVDSAGHRPLKGRPGAELFLLYRYWIWANLQRIAFEQALNTKELHDPRDADHGQPQHGLHVRLVWAAGGR